MRPHILSIVIAACSVISAGTVARAAEDKPIRALLVIGGCCHDYEKQKDIITKGVSERANVQWTVAYEPDKGTRKLNPIYEKADWAKGFDVIVHDECSADVKDTAVIERVLKPHKDGLPAVLLHCAMHSFRGEGFPRATAWFEFTGLPSTGHGPQAPIEVTYVDKESPITRGLADWTTIREELYNNSAGKLLDTAKPLARGKQAVNRRGEKQVDDFVVAWTNTYNGKTRVFGTTLGHNNETVADAKYLDLVTRGLLWSVDKLDEKHLKPAKQVYLDPAQDPANKKAPAKAAAKPGEELLVAAGEAPKGPYLGGISARYSRAELAESLLKPSARIAQGFETQFFKTQGDTLEGFVTRESADEVEFRNIAGATTVLKKQDIKSRGTRDISVMPDGLAAKLTPQELSHLLAYLQSLPAK